MRFIMIYVQYISMNVRNLKKYFFYTKYFLTMFKLNWMHGCHDKIMNRHESLIK